MIVDQTREAQKKYRGKIKTASFDRGFYTSKNEEQLATIVDEPCVPPRHSQQYAERLANGSVAFHRLRQRHPGIESAIGALQSGNGLKRCCDHSEIGFERYLADGDLVQVTSSMLKTGGSVGTAGDWLVRTRQYRYDSNGVLKAGLTKTWKDLSR